VLTEIPGAGRIIAFAFSPFGLLWIASGLLLFFILPLRDSAEEIRLDLEELKRSPPAPADLEDTNRTLAELVGAVGDYGQHLQSHTAVVKAMSDAAQGLAAVVARLETQLGNGEAVALPPTSPVPTPVVEEVPAPRPGPRRAQPLRARRVRRDGPLRAR
jgi:hypothetical protein